MHALFVIPLSNRHSKRIDLKNDNKVAVIHPQNVSHLHIFILEPSIVNGPCGNISKSRVTQLKDKCRAANSQARSVYLPSPKAIVR